MACVFCVNPAYRSLLERHQLDTIERVLARGDGNQVVCHERRDVRRVELSDAGAAIVVFIKREWHTYWKDRIRGLVTGRGWGTKSRRELHVLQALRRAGVGCAEPVAMGERGRLRPQGFLMLRAIAGAVPLAEYLRGQSPRGVRARRAFARQLGHEIARLHAAGVDHPDLFSKHILVRPGHDAQTPPEVFFIDLQRSSIRVRVPLRWRLRDLAALDATLPRTLASKTDRWAALAAYLAASGLSSRRRQAARQIARRAAHLASRRKIREMAAA
jgi:tRNA A-37 threonylcarbamoyl transferase component Bud32